MGTALGAVVVKWRGKYRWVCCIVGVFKMDWRCGWGIVEVYKWFSPGVGWGHLPVVVLLFELLDNSCRGA